MCEERHETIPTCLMFSQKIQLLARVMCCTEEQFEPLLHHKDNQLWSLAAESIRRCQLLVNIDPYLVLGMANLVWEAPRLKWISISIGRERGSVSSFRI